MSFQNKKFELDRDVQPWLFEETGQIIDRRGLLCIGKNIISVENVYSQKFDLELEGYTDEEILDFNKSKSAELQTRGIRNAIADFTKASQNRLIKSCALWEPVGKIYFVTLTYPRSYPCPETRKMHFKRFLDTIRKFKPSWAGCWKLEYQLRGAPHYHCVFETSQDHCSLRLDKKFVHDLWNTIIRPSSNGDNGRTEVAYPRNTNRAKYYLTKEVGKTVQSKVHNLQELEDQIEHSGRFWGWHNRKCLQFKGDLFTLPSHIALMVREAVQAHVIAGMKKDGKVKNNADGELVFSSNDNLVDSDMLPSYRVYDDGQYVFEGIRDYIKEKYNTDILTHMQRYCAVSDAGLNDQFTDTEPT